MILKLYVENSELKALYEERVSKHNELRDAGFDLICPQDITITAGSIGNAIDLGVCSAASDFAQVGRCQGCMSYYLYPRSSISKTPLRMSNSIGVIDSGYRGKLIGMVDHIGKEDFVVKKGARLFQLCAPNLAEILIEFVDSAELLGLTTRGNRGFGSTGM
jgi:dUTP pyrophosphatase